MVASLSGDDRELRERDGALVAPDDWLAAVRRSGRARLVLVTGEAGVGKTVLLRRFAAGAGSATVLSGGCDPLSTPAPLGPLVEITEELRGASAELIAEGGAHTRSRGRCSPIWSPSGWRWWCSGSSLG